MDGWMIFINFQSLFSKELMGKKVEYELWLKNYEKKEREKCCILKKRKKNEMNSCMHGLNDVHQIKKKKE